ncbi:MAG: hypothetical protein Q8R18_05955 [bacterium]|nr:hypothetical protein [bacterium]
MAQSPIQSLFDTPKAESEEEKKKKAEEIQKKNNPFLHNKTVSMDKGVGAYRVSLDNMGDSIEKHYYHFQKFFTKHEDTSFGIHSEELLKLKDVFDASVSSSFHGQIGSKTSALQQQISGYLTQIGQLSKSLFPMVREIRLMDERLELYKKSFSDKKEDSEARQNEIALKSTWIEVVEQGMQNPNSVYSMATKLGFVTLPDLFFGVNPQGKTIEEQQKNLTRALAAIEKEQAFNTKVRDVLTKKLVQYYTWKDKTWNEMRHTYKFRIKNLKQHHNVVLLYVSWLKPYMTALKALQMKGDINSPDLISAFETSKLELELLAVVKKGKKYRACVLVRCTIVTRPELSYTQGGGKQVLHSGQIDIKIEPYVATQEDIDYYKKYTEKEHFTYYSGTDVDMIGDIDAMLKSLGTDVEEYLREAETGERKEKKKEEEKELGILDPFKGLVDSFKMFWPEKLWPEKGESKKETFAEEKEKKDFEEIASAKAWLTYDVFKKSNGMMTL